MPGRNLRNRNPPSKGHLAMPEKPRRLATIESAANHAQCSQKTIRRYIAAGHLTGFRLGPRLIRVDLDELDRFLRPIPAAGTAGVAS